MVRLLTIPLSLLISALFLNAIAVPPSAAETPAPAATPDLPSAEDLAFFESKIRPLLIEACVDCHNVDDPQSDLQLDTLAGMLSGGTSGPALVRGQPEESLMMAVVDYRDEVLRMPPDGKLPESQIELLREWIRRGAPHPDSDQTAPQPRRSGSLDLEEARQFWAFRPIDSPPVPTVQNRSWVQQPPDAFILAALESQSIQPAPPADKRALIRRATFDLTGLPPTADDIDAFLADDSPQAFEKVIDRLLDSAAYGEHWGRHWLDIARYADSNGLDENVALGNAWRYRDYVIRSLNQDKPLDQFIVEQLAGDLLVAATQAESSSGESAPAESSLPEPLSAEDADRLIATGFLSLGAKVLAEPDQTKMRMDIIDEQIDTVGRALMGLTLACARCHDHKFDPISTADYYALAGILSSTHTMESLKTVAKWNENVIASAEDVQRLNEHNQQVAAAEAIIAQRETTAEADLTEPQRAELASLREQLETLKKSAPQLPTAMGVREAEAIEDVRIHVRGSHLTLGMSVPRGIPQLLADDDGFTVAPDSSGRLEMAQWMVSRDNPLTARVMANRLWRWHFGRGLVETTDNFGLLGTEPSHPELLDWLASDLIDSGWSLKSMHRRVMLSSTYQQSSRFSQASYDRDPNNQLFWRSDVRRLQAESIRDAILAVSGQLDRSMGGSILNVENRGYIFDHTSNDRTSYDSTRRSVYLPVIRNNLYDPFALFDYTAADVPNGDRETSTVAPQALYLMNSDLVLQAAQTLAQRLAVEVPDDPAQRLQRLYRTVLGRPAQLAEQQRTLAFIERFSALAASDDATASDDSAASDGSVSDAAAGEDEVGEVQLTSHRSAADQTADPGWVAACQSLLACSEFLYIP